MLFLFEELEDLDEGMLSFCKVPLLSSTNVDLTERLLWGLRKLVIDALFSPPKDNGRCEADGCMCVLDRDEFEVFLRLEVALVLGGIFLRINYQEVYL